MEFTNDKNMALFSRLVTIWF